MLRHHHTYITQDSKAPKRERNKQNVDASRDNSRDSIFLGFATSISTLLPYDFLGWIIFR